MKIEGSGLRQRQLLATRASIIKAFLALAHAENAVTISIPAVARHAGVSVRTVYRHFANKDDLQTAAALHYDDRARSRIDSAQGSGTDVGDYLTNLWAELATELPAVLAEHASPAGRALRTTRLPVARQMVAQAFGPGPLDDETTDLIIAVSSSSMFLELVDRMGHEPKRAAEMITALVTQIAANAISESAETNEHTPEEYA